MQRKDRDASWPRTKTSACTAACAPSAARRRRMGHAEIPADVPSRRLGPRSRNAEAPISGRAVGMNVFASPDETMSRHQRLRGQVRQRERLGLRLGQRDVRQIHPSAWACRSARAISSRSNIQGLPTWYEVRVTEKGHGYLGRRGGVDLMVAMNPQTWDATWQEVSPGGYLFYDSTMPLPPSKFREDIHRDRHAAHRDLCNRTTAIRAQRQLFKNIVYRRGAVTSARTSRPRSHREFLFGDQLQGQGEAARRPTSRRCTSAATTRWRAP